MHFSLIVTITMKNNLITVPIPQLCQESCLCQTDLNQESILTSPQMFTADTRCTYNITSSQGTGINITFDRLKVCKLSIVLCHDTPAP